VAQDPNAWWSKEFADEMRRDFVQQCVQAKDGWKRSSLTKRILVTFCILMAVVGDCFFFRWLMLHAK
jgi:hypothetical protein